MKKLFNKNESGRSMVEMLGVLAVIGVLSVGGISGYKMAMNRHKLNKMFQIASLFSLSVNELKNSYTEKETPYDGTAQKSLSYFCDNFLGNCTIEAKNICVRQSTCTYRYVATHDGVMFSIMSMKDYNAITFMVFEENGNQLCESYFSAVSEGLKNDLSDSRAYELWYNNSYEKSNLSGLLTSCESSAKKNILNGYGIWFDWEFLEE